MAPTVVRPSAQFVSDAELERMAAKRGRASAEAFLLLELREARSEGRDVVALRAGGSYTVAASFAGSDDRGRYAKNH